MRSRAAECRGFLDIEGLEAGGTAPDRHRLAGGTDNMTIIYDWSYIMTCAILTP
jgi:hypothetical protein